MIAKARKWTQQEIAQRLATDDRWLYRGICAIYERQTADEQDSEATRHHNGVGFSAFHASSLSWMAKQIRRWRAGDSHYATPLNATQTAKARRMMACYAGQLTRIANGEV